MTNTTDEFYQASDFCETCVLGKISKNPVPKASNNKSTQKLETVYCDVFGPVNPSSVGDNRYANKFIDVFSGYAVEKLMNYKMQALQAFKEYVAQNGC